MNLITITATDLPDAWFQSLYACVEHGREFRIDRGSFAGQRRLELDYITVHIARPGLRDTDGLPLIPVMPEGSTVPAPVSKDYLADYARYIMTGDKEPGEGYSYGNRLWSCDTPSFFGLDQVTEVCERMCVTPRDNQCVLQIAQPDDLLRDDPPCLRHIDCRVQDGKLHFIIYFRSWDLWGGMPANLAGLSMLQEHMAGEIGVECGEFICSSKGLHLYDYIVPFARLRTLNQVPQCR